MIDMGRKVVVLLVLIFTLPLLSSNGNTIVSNASAADSCSGDIEPIIWNQTVGRSALVPHYNYYSGYFGFGDGREMTGGRWRWSARLDAYCS